MDDENVDLFGWHLSVARRDEWTSNYIDYDYVMGYLGLMVSDFSKKNSLAAQKIHVSTGFLPADNDVEESPLLVSSTSSPGLVHRWSESPKKARWGIESNSSRDTSVGHFDADSDQHQLSLMLDEQLEKVALFYLEEQGRIAFALSQLKRKKEGKEINDDGEEDNFHGSEVTVANNLLELFHFVAINMTVLRKLLNRHDGIVRVSHQSKPPLLRKWYVKTRDNPEGSHLKILLHPHGLVALLNSLKGYVLDDVGFLPNYESIIHTMELFLSKIKKAEKRSVGHLLIDGSCGNGIGLEPSIYRNRFDPVLDQGDADMQLYCDLRVGMFNGTPMTKQETEAEMKRSISADLFILEEDQRRLIGNVDEKKDDVWPLGLWLNLVAAFLYMTNYYIAGPTSVKYMSALGGDDALASMLIGATPWAVIASTFIYSIWTNYSFKQPLIFSSIFLCLGNYLYAIAFERHSIFCVIAGRLLIGFGAPRLINRRFIADTATVEQRTIVSAAFVTFSAVGTTVGPGLAVLLQEVDMTFQGVHHLCF